MFTGIDSRKFSMNSKQLSERPDHLRGGWAESTLTPYRDLLRWRRRFWWSAALNLALAAVLAWYHS